jgi:hypothetical protein
LDHFFAFAASSYDGIERIGIALRGIVLITASNASASYGIL